VIFGLGGGIVAFLVSKRSGFLTDILSFRWYFLLTGINSLRDFVANIALTYKPVAAYTPPVKNNILSKFLPWFLDISENFRM
jgi:hypothetical protein